MKTSHILLAVISILTLTGMIGTDMLLKQQYDKIDWTNPYQQFEQRTLPIAKHWVIEGTPTSEIIIEKANTKGHALIDPEQIKHYRMHQQGDTVFIAFTPDFSGYQNEPRADADRELRVLLVLRLPTVQTLSFENGRLTLSGLIADSMAVSLQKSRLRTNKITSSKSFSLTSSQNSFAILGEDYYHNLQTIVEDSSGVQLNNCQVDSFIKLVSPKAEIQLRGKALTWLK
ncbi:hypothetical protein [Spirosoma pollinicola]|uniref:Uncharacterized protein n=1 Tax=Spirosoma pollinicola TaxID=2057025 RepID=A0A2K8Z2A7_9BACT|nr:hypothetical protein [Spirosoma pollinicola]AUD03964.1 hypothetical protein CWM47_20340 [Spirosoma pollinicola]